METYQKCCLEVEFVSILNPLVVLQRFNWLGAYNDDDDGGGGIYYYLIKQHIKFKFHLIAFERTCQYHGQPN